ncbi:DUF6603 domain-containing protein [Micromonospora sp. NPDC005173]|uniref:DUF6603 domain-containing protein n=1 Tax=Micromonospora sp. NPDC005173 TaxID=3157165 RepID=UPI0033A18501
MSDNASTLELIARHLTLALRPLHQAVSGPDAFKQFMLRLGWGVTSLPPEYTALGARVEAAVQTLEALADEPSPEEALALLGQVKDVYDAIQSLSVAPAGVDAATFLAEIGERLFELLWTEYLATSLPAAYNLFQAMDVIQLESVPSSSGRPAFMRAHFRWDRIPQIAADPLSLIKGVYGWGTSDLNYIRILEHSAELLVAFRLPAALRNAEEELTREYSGIFDDPLHGTNVVLRLPFYYLTIAGTRREFAFVMRELPAAGASLPGLVIEPDVPSELPLTLRLAQDLDLKIRAGSDIASRFGILVRPDGISVKYPFMPGQELPRAGFGLSFDFHPPSSVLLLGSAGATRLEVSGAEAGLQANYLSGQLELIMAADVRGLALVLAAGEGDSFVRDLLGDGEKRVDIPLGVEWSSTRGLHFKGGGGFEVELPSHLELGPILVEAVQIRLYLPPDAGPRLRTRLGANLTGQLGPLTATVQGIGIQLELLFEDGNAGPFDVGVGLQSPDGVGLAISGGGFTGGGFLRFDVEKGEYSGLLELEFQGTLALKAVGLLNTILPGGQPGFSLIVIITAEFPPVQLGFGFTLTGVGGLLGFNRSVMVERLRSGLRDGTLDSILFPEDVVANANRILSDVRQVFPPTPGRFVLGPMARIEWGTPTLITIDLGLIVELPNPVRLLILGIVRMVLPDEKARILQLQVNFLGVIDFEAGTLAFDASIFDSRLLTFPLSGDMAVRLKWFGDANFLLTVGGFHPLYQPPPLDLPQIRRITLQLLDADNPRLTLETYFALTSNTVQFGARLELYAAAGSFSVYGFLSFDVLFQFNPFYFIADIGAMLALRAGSSTIASISLAFTLEGPTPWHAHGKATLKICWFLSITVRFDRTWGEQRDTRLDDIAVLPLLRAALSDPGNWQASLAPDKNLMVTLKQIDPGGPPVVSPAGVLTISQKVVPLNVEVQKFGAQTPADATRFRIQEVTVGPAGDAASLETAVASEDFAPAQFFERSDTQKLTGKSFEKYDAGVRIQASEELKSDYAALRLVEYELFYKDDQRALAPWFDLFQVEPLSFEAWSVGGAVARSPLSHARKAKPADAPGEVNLRQEEFAVVFARDLSPVPTAAFHASEAAANALLEQMLRQQPGLANEILVVPAFEVNRS